MAEPDADGTVAFGDPEHFRSQDELRNLWFALVDCVWRVKGWGQITESTQIDEARMAEVKPLLEDLMIVWGSKAEEALLNQESATAEGRAEVTTGYGANSNRPFVQLAVDGQYRPEIARQVALQILDAATVAEDDAMVLRWARDRMSEDMRRDVHVAEKMMMDLRTFREESRREDREAEADSMPDVAEVRRGVRAIS